MAKARIEGADAKRAAGYGPLADGMSRMGAFLEQLFAIPDAQRGLLGGMGMPFLAD